MGQPVETPRMTPQDLLTLVAVIRHELRRNEAGNALLFRLPGQDGSGCLRMGQHPQFAASALWRHRTRSHRLTRTRPQSPATALTLRGGYGEASSATGCSVMKLLAAQSWRAPFRSVC